jgi:hypothetical protein
LKKYIPDLKRCPNEENLNTIRLDNGNHIGSPVYGNIFTGSKGVIMNKLLVEYNKGNDNVSLKIGDHRIEIPLSQTSKYDIKSNSLDLDDQKKIIKLLVENL